MTSLFCPTLRAAVPWRRSTMLRELRANPSIGRLDLATLGSASTVAVALVSALAMALLGGA